MDEGVDEVVDEVERPYVRPPTPLSLLFGSSSPHPASPGTIGSRDGRLPACKGKSRSQGLEQQRATPLFWLCLTLVPSVSPTRSAW